VVPNQRPIPTDDTIATRPSGDEGDGLDGRELAAGGPHMLETLLILVLGCLVVVAIFAQYRFLTRAAERRKSRRRDSR
jgi:hypothetical protein